MYHLFDIAFNYYVNLMKLALHSNFHQPDHQLHCGDCVI